MPLATLTSSTRAPSFLTVVALVGAFAAASRIEFETATGSAVPTQLVLVPMLFALPVGDVPLYVMLGLVIGQISDYVSGRVHPERVTLLIGSAWYSLGPALVVLAVGEASPTLDDWPLYLAALAAQFLVDGATSIARETAAIGIRARSLVGPLAGVFLVDALLAPAGLAAAFAAAAFDGGFVLVFPLLGLIALFAREHRVSVDHAIELSHAYRGTAFLLGDVVEADDEYTGAHSRQVVELVLGVADEFGLDPLARRKAEFTALLHDVGKIKIPSEIINKPGRLDEVERALMETHTLEGERILDRVGGLLGEVGTLVRSCHERYDGRGYPDGLQADEIPLIARVVCCCDAFNAMTTDRSYRQALPLVEAIAELQRNAGTQFDPTVVEALVHFVARTS